MSDEYFGFRLGLMLTDSDSRLFIANRWRTMTHQGPTTVFEGWPEFEKTLEQLLVDMTLHYSVLTNLKQNPPSDNSSSVLENLESTGKDLSARWEEIKDKRNVMRAQQWQQFLEGLEDLEDLDDIENASGSSCKRPRLQ